MKGAEQLKAHTPNLNAVEGRDSKLWSSEFRLQLEYITITKIIKENAALMQEYGCKGSNTQRSQQIR